jgi:TP901-1 family phage major tail protein
MAGFSNGLDMLIKISDSCAASSGVNTGATPCGSTAGVDVDKLTYEETCSALTGDAVYTTIGGITSSSFSINKEAIEISALTQDGSGTNTEWTQKTAEGLKSVSISGSGTFYDSSGENMVRWAVFNDRAPRCSNIIIPGLGTFTGLFVLSNLEYTGESSGGVTFSISLESDGEITFA